VNFTGQIVGIGNSLRFQSCDTHGRKIILCIFWFTMWCSFEMD